MPGGKGLPAVDRKSADPAIFGLRQLAQGLHGLGVWSRGQSVRGVAEARGRFPRGTLDTDGRNFLPIRGWLLHPGLAEFRVIIEVKFFLI